MLQTPAPSAPLQSYEIQGHTIRLPVEVRDASTAVATFLVSSRVARSIVPPAFEVVELLPRRTPLSIAAIDYRDNDLGDYDEVSLTFFVRPRDAGRAAPGPLGRPVGRGIPWLGAWRDLARGRLGTWIWKLPVNQSFTCEAGRTIWGFPKTVEQIEIRREGARVRCRLAMDGAHVLTFSVPYGGSRSLPEQETVTYTQIEGVAHRTRFTQSGSGVGFAAGGARIELGTHPIAHSLGALGLPKRALFSMWTECMRGRFEAPEKL
ncbi:MAG: acetoacetate decarboxylase [Proteobacteria bacterium]|nr:MAG: acetoacetate decarboxylase [Pseudomonadota bacterium]